MKKLWWVPYALAGLLLGPLLIGGVERAPERSEPDPVINDLLITIIDELARQAMPANGAPLLVEPEFRTVVIRERGAQGPPGQPGPRGPKGDEPQLLPSPAPSPSATPFVCDWVPPLCALVC